MVNAYPLHGCVMVVVAATQNACVPADKAAAVRAALAYVLGSFGLVGGCVCAWVLSGKAVQNGLGKDLALGAINIWCSYFAFTMIY